MAHVTANGSKASSIPPRRIAGAGPRQQFLGFAALLGCSLAAYIYVKGTNADEKKRLDAIYEANLARDRAGLMGNDARELPTRRRGGVGVSSASSKAGSRSSPESHFLDVQRVDGLSNASGTGMRPMTLAQYRAMNNSADIVRQDKSDNHNHRLHDRWDAFRNHH